MALAKKMEDRLHPAGTAYLTLDCVEEAMIASQFSKRPDGMSPVFYWQFLSATKDETGVPYGLRHMTDAQLTPNNKTTKFWKQLVPGVRFEDIDGDTTPLEGKRYVAEIVHEQKGDKTFANIAFIKPYVASGARGGGSAAPLATTRPQAPPPVTEPEPEDDGHGDPFADE